MAFFAVFFMTLLLFPHVLTQDPTITTSTCTSRLLTLAPCGPFVQGIAQFPVQLCCDNLRQLYAQEPSCLCLSLNGTFATAFPINSTLALQLPQLCGLRFDDLSVCPGIPLPPDSSVSPSPSSAGSQISLGTKNNSTVASSPVVQVAPRPSIMGLGLGRNTGPKIKIKQAALIIAAFLSVISLV